MVPVEQYVDTMLAQSGDRYVFGVEASPLDPNPHAFDCSELTQWAADRCHVTPALPDGAFNQWKHCPPIAVPLALHTRGALLFAGTGSGGGRNAIHHVACSLGDGTTIEARGHLWGVGTWSGVGRFSYAGLVPGVDYSGTHPPHKVNQGGGIQVLPGATSATVKQLQHGLNIIRSHEVPPREAIREDGQYGNQTKAAVAEFQRYWNSKIPGSPLPVTGGCDPKTFQAAAFTVAHILQGH